MYRPHLVSLVAPPTQRVYFRLTVKAWSAEVDKVKERLRNREEGSEAAALERLHGPAQESTQVRNYNLYPPYNTIQIIHVYECNFKNISTS